MLIDANSKQFQCKAMLKLSIANAESQYLCLCLLYALQQYFLKCSGFIDPRFMKYLKNAYSWVAIKSERPFSLVIIHFQNGMPLYVDCLKAACQKI